MIEELKKIYNNLFKQTKLDFKRDIDLSSDNQAIVLV